MSLYKILLEVSQPINTHTRALMLSSFFCFPLPDLKVGETEAQDILRQVDHCRAGPSSSQLPSSTPIFPVHGGTPNPHSVSARSKASIAFPTWTCGSRSLDHLFLPLSAIARLEAVQEPNTPPNLGLKPGMVVELAGPPGIGKTSILTNIALSARTGGCGRRAKGKQVEVLVVDCEGGMTPQKFKSAAMESSLVGQYPFL